MPNINYIKKLANGSEDFQLKMIDILKKEFPKEKALFLEYCEMQDLLRAANVVHKIKHKFSMLDMKDAYNYAMDFENELKKDQKSMYSGFINILNQTDNFIKQL